MKPKQTQSTEIAMNPRDWWVYLVQGIIVVLVGLFLFAAPVKTLFSLVLFLGFYWLVAGIVDVVRAILDIDTSGSRWGLRLVVALLSIFAGLVVINYPIVSTLLTPVIFMYIVAFTFIINGIVSMIVGADRHGTGVTEWSWGNFFLGLLYLVLGLLLLSSPVLLSTASVVFGAALLAVVAGAVLMVFSFKVRKMETPKAAA